MHIRSISCLSAMSLLSIMLIACQGPKRGKVVIDAFSQAGLRLPDEPDSSVFPLPKSYEDVEEELVRIRTNYKKYKGQSLDGGSPLPSTSLTSTERRYLRVEMAYSMITIIKHYHEATEDDLYQIATQLESVFDILGLAVNAYGTASGSKSVKTGANAAAGALLGTRRSLEANILADQTKLALNDQMNAMRLRQETKIRQNLDQLSDTVYPFHRVRDDLYDFYTAGSIREAVASLSKLAQEEKENALKERALLDDRTTLRAGDIDSMISRVGVAINDITVAISQMSSLAFDRSHIATAEGYKERLELIQSSLTSLRSQIFAADGLLLEKNQLVSAAQAALDQMKMQLEADPNSQSAQSAYDAAVGALKSSVESQRQAIETVNDLEAQLPRYADRISLLEADISRL